MVKEMSNRLFYSFVGIALLGLVLFFFFQYLPHVSLSGYQTLSPSGVDLVFDKNIPWENLSWMFSSSSSVTWDKDIQGELYGYTWNVAGLQDPMTSTFLYAGEELSLNLSMNHVLDEYKTEDLTIEITNGSSLLYSIRTRCDRTAWFKGSSTTIMGRVNGKWQVLYRTSTTTANCERDLFGYGIHSLLGITFSSSEKSLRVRTLNKQFTVDKPGTNKIQLRMTLKKDASYARTLSIRYGSLSVINDAVHARYQGKEVVRLDQHTSVDSFTVYITNRGNEAIDENTPIIVEGLLRNQYNDVKQFRGEIKPEQLLPGKKVPVELFPVNELSGAILSMHTPGTWYTLTFSVNEKQTVTENNYKNNQKAINLCVGDCYREEQGVTGCIDSDEAGGAIGTKGTVTLAFNNGRKTSVTDTCLSSNSLIEYSCDAFGSATFSQGYWKKVWTCPEMYTCIDGACEIQRA